MTSILSIGSGNKYQELNEKVANINSRLTNMFNRTVSLVYSVNIVSSVLIVGYVALAALATTAIALSGSPIHATIVKCAMIFGAAYGIAALAIITVVAVKSRNVIKDNPL